jgi:hypothetical protein
VHWDNTQVPQIPDMGTRFFPAEKTFINALTQDFRLQISNKSLYRRSGIITPIGLTDVLTQANPAFTPGELTDLIAELNVGKYKVGGFRKFFIWLKTLFYGNYDVAVAKLAFSKITNKSAFLNVAFNYIALPRNESTFKENITFLINLQTDLPSSFPNVSLSDTVLLKK